MPLREFKKSQLNQNGMTMPLDNASVRPKPDDALTSIADYTGKYEIINPDAWRMARYCVMDALGCAVEALNFPDCTKLLGPVVPGMICPDGSRIPGTRYELDPVRAAFNIGTMIRWLDFNDCFPAANGGHPSDNLGGILAVADYLSRTRVRAGKPPLLMRDVLEALIKSYEIQGVLSLDNDFARLGCDYLPFPKVAATAVITRMLGGSHEEIVNAVSNAWADGISLNVYRQGSNTGSRKSWAGGETTSRAVALGLMAMKGEMGYPAVLSARNCGFYDALFEGKPFRFQRPFGSYVMENIMFKLVPSASLAQSAVECAFKLHAAVKDRVAKIASITIRCHDKLIESMDKKGALTNPADRDHCAQYVVAIGLIHGKLGTMDFDEEFAADPRIDHLRALMTVTEEPRYTADRRDPAKRSNANALEIRFRDGSCLPKVEVEYPWGHPRCRAEGIPMLEAKFSKHLARRFPHKQQSAIIDSFADQGRFEATPVNEFLSRFVI